MLVCSTGMTPNADFVTDVQTAVPDRDTNLVLVRSPIYSGGWLSDTAVPHMLCMCRAVRAESARLLRGMSSIMR